MRRAIAIAAIQEGSLLLVRKKEIWIPPGGKPEGNETNGRVA